MYNYIYLVNSRCWSDILKQIMNNPHRISKQLRLLKIQDRPFKRTKLWRPQKRAITSDAKPAKTKSKAESPAPTWASGQIRKQR